MRSLNLENGCKVSDFEGVLLVLDALLDKQLASNPKSGMILNKGTSSEYRLKYSKAKAVLEEIYTQAALAGKFSIGVCQTCKRFNDTYSKEGMYGKCPNKSDYVHAFDTCEKHTGGGFGRQ